MCCAAPARCRGFRRVVEGFHIRAPIRTVNEMRKRHKNSAEIHCQFQLRLIMQRKFTLENLPRGLSSEHVSDTVSPS